MTDISLQIEESLAILGVASGASMKEIRSAFRRLARTCHPDIAGPQTAAEFEKITAAYLFLKKKGTSLTRKETKTTKDRYTRTKPKREGFRKAQSQRTEKKANPEKIRHLLTEKIIVEAEIKMARLMEKVAEKQGESDFYRSQKRLLSSHPEVRSLAASLLFNHLDEKGVVDSFAEMIQAYPEDEYVLQYIFDGIYFQNRFIPIAEAVAAKASQLTEKVALSFLRWIARFDKRKIYLERFLSHPSEDVVAKALTRWPHGKGLPDDLSLIRLLKKDKEEILVPLLQILRREENVPSWTMTKIKLLAQSHSAASVRVWAGSIVRNKNLV
jgi:curved DNA-binding protein CbpA